MPPEVIEEEMDLLWWAMMKSGIIETFEYENVFKLFPRGVKNVELTSEEFLSCAQLYNMRWHISKIGPRTEERKKEWNEYQKAYKLHAKRFCRPAGLFYPGDYKYDVLEIKE
jgi:hypothetical protein